MLRDLQRQRNVMALVSNEYGGSEGLVTMKDIPEELVDEIQDDSDEERPMVEQINETTYFVLATQSLEDLNALLPHPLHQQGDYESLAGILLGRFGRLPSEGEKPESITTKRP
ncbi:hypothetical protein GCM10027341_50590 [Spirosoma knui]